MCFKYEKNIVTCTVALWEAAGQGGATHHSQGAGMRRPNYSSPLCPQISMSGFDPRHLPLRHERNVFKMNKLLISLLRSHDWKNKILSQDLNPDPHSFTNLFRQKCSFTLFLSLDIIFIPPQRALATNNQLFVFLDRFTNNSFFITVMSRVSLRL